MGLGIAIAIKGKPDPELIQARKLIVSERISEATTFQIQYDLDISEGDIPLLTDGRLDAGSELSVLVPIDGQIHCLVKGPVHKQQVRLRHGGAGSTLEVFGSDTSIIMDRETRSAIWADLTDSDAVQTILSKYGYTSDVQTTSAGHYEAKHTLVQRDSDLRFVRRLARRNGYLFWISCDAQGTETAHFKRPPLRGGPSAELVINLASPRIQTLDITWDAERPTSIEGSQLDLNTLSEMNGAVATTPQPILGTQGLQAITGDTRSIHLAAPADDTGDLTARGEGALIEADWFTQATCQTSLDTLGTLVRAHTLVKVRGAGSRHSGDYFVAGVRHTIDAESHRMEMELWRNGWGS